MAIAEGTLLWEPSVEQIERSNLKQYMSWLGERKGLVFQDYHALWQWSVTDLEAFWASIWEYFGIMAKTPYERVLAQRVMPGAKWFTGATLNYAEHIFRGRDPNREAIHYASEIRPLRALTWRDLQNQVAAFRAALKAAGVRKGDRVVAYVANMPEAVVAFLAAASLGAIWSSCSPEFGARSVIDRFKQIEPKVLIAVDGYRYGGKDFDRTAIVAEIKKALPTLKQTVIIPYLKQGGADERLSDAILWDDFTAGYDGAPLGFEPVAFDHPLWILYSSGTTGIPKAIVQGHGGILLEHLKALTLHTDLGPDDRFFWYTTTGWMMWNFLVSGLLTGAQIILYDGSPSYPDYENLWAFAERTGMTVFGTSAGFLTACMKAGITPGMSHDLGRLRAIGSTGSPLSPAGFEWVYTHVKKEIWLASVSGGTDVCSAFVLGAPTLPVRAGEIQCRGLGVAASAFDEAGNPLIDAVGELVLTEPLPSMPIYFWNDPDGSRYRNSYFNMYPGVWRHGDYLKITSQGGCVIYGRSDATINRGGVRMGTSEIYGAVESLPEIKDSLIIDVPVADGRSFMPLFVVLADGAVLNEALIDKIKRRIRTQCSPRHVPDAIYETADIPYTINGKKLEVPVKKILLGTPVEKAANPDSLKNPKALDFFVTFSRKFAGQ
ncbi:acetoacetate--CoA ligase [Caenibacillus caldisaponilyticus]|uniref:acetoacetate--CoA ligase n=1 Tax=Caenibacillus caldisaponilyticus TaxID=1674942 RepID=UPI000988719F|nr:acetoacetate--CoA ligase [Caenibacillus caldisaponilyticus]